jgi:succinyl-CoA synthetase alpha subunit
VFLEEKEVLVQGITGREGSFHTKLMLGYGTRIVAGVTPGKSGMNVEGVPVYNTVKEAILEHPNIGYSVSFVPPAHSYDSTLEALDAGISMIVVITEGIPIKDTLWLVNYAKTSGCQILGPNCPGVIIPQKFKLGIIPGNVFMTGNIGLISRSGTLTYEVGNELAIRGLGVSAALGVGGDAIVGTSILEVAKRFESDPGTVAIVVLGELGGNMEEDLASAIAMGTITKPVVSYIAGLTAPPGKRMGHAGAIISGGSGTAQEKLEKLKKAGAITARSPKQIPELLSNLLL